MLMGDLLFRSSHPVVSKLLSTWAAYAQPLSVLMRTQVQPNHDITGLGITEMGFLLMAAEQGPYVLFCLLNGTECILLVSVMRDRPPPRGLLLRVPAAQVAVAFVAERIDLRHPFAPRRTAADAAELARLGLPRAPAGVQGVPGALRRRQVLSILRRCGSSPFLRPVCSRALQGVWRGSQGFQWGLTINGPNVPFCMPNRTKCILLVSLMPD
jgi:hypothetical protein